MSLFLGIDTSNYTTSAALWEGTPEEGHIVVNSRRLLPVKQGALGLRQSDAVFAHVKQFTEVLRAAVPPEGLADVKAIGVSTRPRTVEGSYMPCFLVGKLAAESIAMSLNIPCYEFSHQQGHVMAAISSIGKAELKDAPFISFHVSGGTTECLLVTPREGEPLHCEKIGGTLDLSAGQAIDRLGQMLELPFPAGPYIDKLASESDKKFRIKPVMKGGDCCLSGLENQARKRLADGERKEDVCLFALCSVAAAIEGMLSYAKEQYGDLPVVLAGGVMCNSYIRRYITERHRNAFFGEPSCSSDNAVGAAALASDRFRMPLLTE